MSHERHHAFTLAEIALTLAVLGLLIGGLLFGNGLIQAKERQSISVEYAGHKTAMATFRNKYLALPGDMTTATRIWGSAGSTGKASDPACANIPSPTATCDGDGNGRYNPQESLRAWQQLANAGIIAGHFTGARANFSGYAHPFVATVNVPGSKHSPRAFWHALSSANQSATNSSFSTVGWDNYFMLFSMNTPSITPGDALKVDAKLDDGLPSTGTVVSSKGDGTTTFCTTMAGTATDAGATYVLDNPNPDCHLYFIRAY
ncbi:MAG: hypothetical protein SFW64_07790 [Alphaproteobacteria bacterium]|nr:hypothetical protein [Alphaproteobacteria bacterium]